VAETNCEIKKKNCMCVVIGGLNIAFFKIIKVASLTTDDIL
jgi:hypothetical protein